MPVLQRLFRLKEHSTTVHTEVTAGLTTFAAMAYILAVNPQILSAAGMDFGAVVTATALSSALMTALMGLLTNYPLALAPGMGLNAFFAFTVCQGMGIPWQAALAMVFCNGFLFLLLSIAGIRKRILESIPHELKIAITCGIGFFIAFIGLQKGGLVVPHPATFVAAGSFAKPGPWLVLFGVVLMCVLHFRRVRGAIILSILLLSLIGLFLPAQNGNGHLTELPARLIAAPASLAPTFLSFDFHYLIEHPHQTLPLIFAFLFVDLFDNIGTLIGVCNRIGLLDAKGNLPRIGRAMTADACAAMAGSCLGTSTVTTYIESAAGAEVGGRTGLTSLTVSACFLAALVFHPLIRVIPVEATAPALVVVGIFMMQSLRQLDVGDFAKAVPSMAIILLMPLTFSISEGLAIGFVIYAAFMLGSGRWREVSVTAWILGILFLWHLASR